jgi:hypothetical protein
MSAVSRVPCSEYSVRYFPLSKDSGNTTKSQVLRISYDAAKQAQVLPYGNPARENRKRQSYSFQFELK